MQESPDSEDDEDDFEYRATRVVLVRGLDIASDDVRTRKPVERGFEARERIRQVSEDRF